MYGTMYIYIYHIRHSQTVFDTTTRRCCSHYPTLDSIHGPWCHTGAATHVHGSCSIERLNSQMRQVAALKPKGFFQLEMVVTCTKPTSEPNMSEDSEGYWAYICILGAKSSCRAMPLSFWPGSWLFCALLTPWSTLDGSNLWQAIGDLAPEPFYTHHLRCRDRQSVLPLTRYFLWLLDH